VSGATAETGLPLAVTGTPLLGGILGAIFVALGGIGLRIKRQ